MALSHVTPRARAIVVPLIDAMSLANPNADRISVKNRVAVLARPWLINHANHQSSKFNISLVGFYIHFGNNFPNHARKTPFPDSFFVKNGIYHSQ